MIHDPLAMTSSVSPGHNIRICIPAHYIGLPTAPGKGSLKEGGAKCTLEAQRKKLSFELAAGACRAPPLINSTNWKFGEAGGESLFITESNLLNCTMSNGANMVL